MEEKKQQDKEGNGGMEKENERRRGSRNGIHLLNWKDRIAHTFVPFQGYLDLVCISFLSLFLGFFFVCF